MSREMFDDVIEPTVKVGTRKWYAVPLSMISHALALGAVVAIPLFATDLLPLPQTLLAFAAPPPPPALTSPPPPSPTRPDPRVIDVTEDAFPVEAPATLSPEAPPRSPGLPGTLGAIGVGGLATSFGAVMTIPDPPPSPPRRVAPLPVGGAIQPPKLLKRVDPVYPLLAKNARIQGYVIVEATIARDGTVKDVRLLKPVQILLDKAALDAVAQWKYSPTLLNGEAVEVLLSVTVTFSLR